MSSRTGPFPYEDRLMPFYALGTNLAMQVGGQGNLKTLLDESEMDIVLQAFCETLKGTATQDPRTILTAYGPELNKLLQQRTSEIVDRVKQDGQYFIENFVDCNPEAVKTNSGLVYYEMTGGGGKQPNPSSTVEVHYHGTLTDGTVFDSSVERGQTISFPLNGVIRGWQEGLAMMKEGGKATLVIPSDLAYGDAGSGETIPPGATLKFEVELFKVS
jgi:FKBP-type peptidyl-prolyl cis-trans isomerase